MTNLFDTNTHSAKYAKSQANSAESGKGYTQALNQVSEIINGLNGVKTGNGGKRAANIASLAALLA